MIICPKCNAQNPDDSAFCENCGTSLEVAVPVKSPVVPVETPVTPDKKGGGAKIAIIIVAVILILALAGVGVWYFVLRDDTVSDNDAGNSVSDEDDEDESEDESGKSSENSDNDDGNKNNNEYFDDQDDVIHDAVEEDDYVEIDDTVSVGSHVDFGSYEQDNDISNGKEVIEWIVLDVQDGKALLISEYGLDSKQYHINYQDQTWETCMLREWLNNDFINSAFLSDEQSEILTVTVPAEANQSYGTDAGNDTQDKIFLLSIDEANRYFRSAADRKCEPTAYAVANGADVRDGYCWWWLRSPGYGNNSAADVLDRGTVNDYGMIIDGVSVVRPALWVDVNSEIFRD